MVYRVGYTLLLAGEADTADHVLHRAMSLSQNLNAPYWLCRTLMALAELHVKSGELQSARGYAAEALELAQGLKHHDFIATAQMLVKRANGKPKSQTRRPQSRTADSQHAPLPNIPVILETPVRGPSAIVAWLDPIVDRLLRTPHAERTG